MKITTQQPQLNVVILIKLFFEYTELVTVSVICICFEMFIAELTVKLGELASFETTATTVLLKSSSNELEVFKTGLVCLVLIIFY